MKDKQLVLITEAERKGIIYGQDVITAITSSSHTAMRSLEGCKGFVDGLMQNITDGKPVTEEQLLRLRDTYFGLLKADLEFISNVSGALWRVVQDNENEARHKDEVARGVNHEQ